VDGASVIATLRNPVYLGLFRDKGDFRIGHHEAIVTHELFVAVSAQLEAHRTRRPGTRYQIDWPFKGRITCAVCGTPMSPHTIRYRNFIYRYYRCCWTAGGSGLAGAKFPHLLSKARCGRIWKCSGASIWTRIRFGSMARASFMITAFEA
jgi:hypothetical protein